MQTGDENGLESLREQFEQAEKQVDVVREKLIQREFITREELDGLVHLLVNIYETREKCVKILESEGLDASECRNLDSLEKALEINRRRRELEERNRRIRQVLEGFFSIIPLDAIHQEALEGFQQELRDCSEETLAEMDRSGELELYRTFTECVRDGSPDPARVDTLKDRFGFQMVYAILAGQLKYVGPEEEKQVPAEGAEPEAGEPGESREPEQAEEAEEAEGGEEEEDSSAPEEAQEAGAEEPEEVPPPVEEDSGEPRIMVSSTFPLPEPGDLPYWEAWRDSTTKVTFQEFRDKVRNLPKARILLPAFTRLGVLDAELMVRFCAIMNWDIPWHSDVNFWHEGESMEEQVERCLWTLTKHGMVAEYRIEGQPKPVYCLTEYTNWCMRHEDIQQAARELFHIHLSDGNVFCIDIGSNEVVARQEMDRDRLLAIRDHNADMADYLSFMNRAFEEQELNRDELLSILNSFSIRNGRYMVLVPGEEKLYLCTVFHSLADYRGSGGALLLTEERPEGPFSTKGPVFHCGGDTLSCWLGKWYTMIHLVEPQPEPEPEPQEEPWPSPEMEERVRQEEALMTDDVIGPVEELAPENEMAQEDEQPPAEEPADAVPEEESEEGEDILPPEGENILPEEAENILPQEGESAPEGEDLTGSQAREEESEPESESEPAAGPEPEVTELTEDGEESSSPSQEPEEESPAERPPDPGPETSALFQVEEALPPEPAPEGETAEEGTPEEKAEEELPEESPEEETRPEPPQE